jgi:hypothetical protein
MGLIGSNNAASPNTKYDLSASAILFYDATNGIGLTKWQQGTLTCDIAIAGENGRDQVSAFINNSWIHFYFIVKADGTVATLASLSATAPNLPFGYVASAYATTIRYTTALAATVARGSWIHYAAETFALSGGGALTEATISISALIPPNALHYNLRLESVQVVSTSAGDQGMQISLRVITGINFHTYAWFVIGQPEAHTHGWTVGPRLMPNINQQFYYMFTVIGLLSASVNFALDSYQVPNGGE